MKYLNKRCGLDRCSPTASYSRIFKIFFILRKCKRAKKYLMESTASCIPTFVRTRVRSEIRAFATPSEAGIVTVGTDHAIRRTQQASPTVQSISEIS